MLAHARMDALSAHFFAAKQSCEIATISIARKRKGANL
jgi:hypothetical protein